MPRTRIDTWQNYANQESTFENGITSGTTDSTGSLVISYTMATTPRSLVVTNVGTVNYHYTITNLTSTGSTVRCFGTGSAAITSTAVTASWIAFV